MSLTTARSIIAKPGGAALYEKHCKSCHMKSGKGLMRLYPPLTDSAWVGNDTLIVKNITEGLEGEITVNGKSYDRVMPKIEGLTNEEIAAIINYVRINFAAVKRKITPTEVAKLRML
jgi:mono/diheme cytochrome c family protein